MGHIVRPQLTRANWECGNEMRIKVQTRVEYTTVASQADVVSALHSITLAIAQGADIRTGGSGPCRDRKLSNGEQAFFLRFSIGVERPRVLRRRALTANKLLRASR